MFALATSFRFGRDMVMKCCSSVGPNSQPSTYSQAHDWSSTGITPSPESQCREWCIQTRGGRARLVSIREDASEGNLKGVLPEE